MMAASQGQLFLTASPVACGPFWFVFDQIKRCRPEKVTVYLSVWKKNYTFTDCFISGNIMIYQ